MCDSVVATRSRTAAGATLFAKNSDRHEGECQPFLQHPAALHPRASSLRCTHIEIPQVAETYRVMGHSPWWVWGFEHGVNEHAVAIGNHSVFSREGVEAEEGLIGMDLVRLGLERGRDAREALEVIAALIEKYGQGGSALGPAEAGYHNSFTIADSSQAWQFETSGRRWAARPVELGALSNHLSLGSNWAIGSRDLDSFARSQGWWRDPARLDVARAYRHPQVPGRLSQGRHARALELLDAGDGNHDVASMKRLLRDHGNGEVGPPTDATPEDERYFTLCMHSEPVGTTTASMVAELSTDPGLAPPTWVAFGSPCVGLFLPVYLDGVIPAELARGGETQEAHEAGSAWWAFRGLSLLATSNPGCVPAIRKGWARLEEWIEQERSTVEGRARAAAEEGDSFRARELLTEWMQRMVDAALVEAEQLHRSALDREG